jgi:hypothetical protein
MNNKPEDNFSPNKPSLHKTKNVFKKPKIFLEDKHERKRRDYTLAFFFFCFGTSVITTNTIFFLQGFHYCGFSLESELMIWLGGATIGQLGIIGTLIYKHYFKKN